MRYLKSVFTKKQIKVLISGFISLVLGLVLLLIGVKVSSKLDTQNLSKRWADDNSYAQISAFMSELADFDETSVKQLNYNIDRQLDTDSIIAASQNARLWVYAYSAKGEATIASKEASRSVTVYGVGGDFFLFHPYTLLSGSYFDSDAVMKDMVVMDRGTAWALFGSSDVVGQCVTVNGVECVISGVVDLEDSKFNEAAGNTGATIFVSYESLTEHGGNVYINCYETLLPNPISDYAYNLVSNQMPVSKNRVEIIENSGRYNWVSLLKVVKAFGTRSMTTKSIVFPYWENIARGTEDCLAPLVVFAIVFFLYPSVVLFLLIIRMIKKRTVHYSDLKNYIERLIEKRRYKKKIVKERKKDEEKK